MEQKYQIRCMRTCLFTLVTIERARAFPVDLRVYSFAFGAAAAFACAAWAALMTASNFIAVARLLRGRERGREREIDMSK